MNAYERLEDEACKDGIDVIDCNFNSDSIKGLYCDGVIGINKNIKNMTERTCILAEELGHHHTSAGNIIDQTKTENRKQEQRARMWAYNKQIGLHGIIDSYKRGCRNIHEMTDYLDVTEDFLRDALEAYRLKYGQYVNIDNYTVYFEPYLMVADFDSYDSRK